MCYPTPALLPDPVKFKVQVLLEFAQEVSGREDDLNKLEELLRQYSRVVNLTGSIEPERIWREFAEALLAVRVLRSATPSWGPWIDVGSGGGLPGLIFAIVGPPTESVLIEPRSRRVDFLRLAKATLGLKSLRIVQGTLSDDGATRPRISVADPSWVSARAVFSPEEWRRRASVAWPGAHCLVHGASANRSAGNGVQSAKWGDHTVELWAPTPENR